MKNPLRKEYLNQYRKGDNGSYVYTGLTYRYSGGSFKKRAAQMYGVLALLAACIVASGSLNAAGLNNCFYVIIPYILEVSALFALCWNIIKLLSKGEFVKDYVYNSTYKKIAPISLVGSAVCAISLICALVFVIINGAEGGIVKCVAYLLLKCAEAVICLVLRKLIVNTEYEIV